MLHVVYQNCRLNTWLSDHSVTRTPRITRARPVAMLAGYDVHPGSGYFPGVPGVMSPGTPAMGRAPAMAPAPMLSGSPLMAMRPVRRMSAPVLPGPMAPPMAAMPLGGSLLAPASNAAGESVPGPHIPVYMPARRHSTETTVRQIHYQAPQPDEEDLRRTVAETFQLGDA